MKDVKLPVEINDFQKYHFECYKQFTALSKKYRSRVLSEASSHESRTLSHSLQLPEFLQELLPNFETLVTAEESSQKELDVVLHVTSETLELQESSSNPRCRTFQESFLIKSTWGKTRGTPANQRVFIGPRKNFEDNLPSGDQKVVLCKRILLENKKSLESR
ncbi:hypothetical protein JTB14_020492 [Gonioctena quinquepunctata]|nr:hypothetical protein JTB14_020492 [Gonioctena quinquepunctata]